MRIWWALALCACSSDEPATTMLMPDAPPAPQPTALAPGACTGDEISLYGMTGSSAATPIAVTVMPTTLCLALDGRDNIRIAHFAAGTPYEQASASSFRMALFDETDALIREGWDVQFSTNVFHNLEYGAPVGAVTRVKLVVDGAGATDVQLHLFEPFE